jgi:hypothetical protein
MIIFPHLRVFTVTLQPALGADFEQSEVGVGDVQVRSLIETEPEQAVADVLFRSAPCLGFFSLIPKIKADYISKQFII